ncbi:unnamed protein product [Ostreobium quekettii]|uniref:15-cis-phytoene synthase n=1 Tax=Ostreobium quekettii TaxID=121088 RepID=A0A8S1ITH9_9CHLO|nr:unnamed protein product [Ostreobium quekettii]
MLLQMRFKWWEDAINAMYNGTPPDHPVIQALGHVLKSRHLTRYRMRRIVTTRQKDALQLEAPADLASLEQYANGTAVQLLLLQLEANGVGNLETEKAAALVGHAVGMTNLLRGTIHHAQRGRVYLPRDLCDQHQVIHADILRGKDSEGVRRVAEAVSKAAEENIKKARELMPAIPLEARPLFLPAVGCALFLSALKARAYNVFDPMWTKSGVSPLWLQLNLKYHLVRGSF